jgi:hypothetical protein
MKQNARPRAQMVPVTTRISPTERIRTYPDGTVVYETKDRPATERDYEHLMQMIHDINESFDLTKLLNRQQAA